MNDRGAVHRGRGITRRIAVVTAGALTVMACTLGAQEDFHGSASTRRPEPPDRPRPDAARDADAATAEDPLFDPAPAADAAARTDAARPRTSALPTCCAGKGSCVPEDLVPEASKASLAADTCATGLLCAPTEALAAGYMPAACVTGPPKGQATTPGVCLSNCVDFGALGGLVRQETCAADHKCVPCTFLGQPTGAPGCK
jgi:hypothetical protein